MNFDLSLISQEKQTIALNKHQDQPMCQFTMKKNTKNVGEQLIIWENFLENILTHINNGYRVLRYVNPEDSEIDHLKVKDKFMTLKGIYNSHENKIFAKISHWNGKFLLWEALQISVNTNGQLHGICSFQLSIPDYNKPGTHPFLNWSLKYFSGRFVNGNLQGVGVLETAQNSVLFVTFKDGELHGPAYGHGQSPIYADDYQVCVSSSNNLISLSYFIFILFRKEDLPDVY